MRLYAELTNNQASLVDVAFWMVIGAVLSALVELGLKQVMTWL